MIVCRKYSPGRSWRKSNKIAASNGNAGRAGCLSGAATPSHLSASGQLQVGRQIIPVHAIVAKHNRQPVCHRWEATIYHVIGAK